MATTPQPTQPYQPQAAPPPPPPRSNALAIILLILGMIVLLAGVAVWGGIRFLAHSVHVRVNDENSSHKQVSIRTPFGSIEANKSGAVTESALSLPIYPGAHQSKDEDSASVSLGFPGSHGLRIVAGKFDTSDSFAKVRNFYKDRLTAQDGPFAHTDHIDSNNDFDSGVDGNFEGTDDSGKTVFKIKLKDDLRIVTIRDNGLGTRIEMVRVGKTTSEAN